jgi:squalene-associated FAD-dependent desaturase
MFDCIVIGGGISGISTFIELYNKKNNVILLESRPFLGGRARSYIDPISKDEIDNGQHILMNCYDTFLDLLRKIGSSDLLLAQKKMKVSFVSKDEKNINSFKKHTLHQSIFGNNLGTLIGLLQFSAFNFREKLSLISFMLGLKLNKPKEMETVLEYLQRRKISEKLIEWLFEPITLATLNAPVNVASAKLLSTVLTLALLSGGNRSAFIIPAKGLSNFFSNSDILSKNSKTSVTVKSISKSKDGYVITDSNEDVYHSKSIVLATPLSTTKKLLEQLEIKVHINEDNSPITSVYLWFDKEVLTEIEEPFFGLIGTLSQWVFNKYKIEPTTSSFAKSLLSIVISASEETLTLTKEQLVDTIYKELSSLFPSISTSNLLHSVVIKEKKATFLSTPTFELERLRTSISYSGVILAGDWTNTGLPATLEGAAVSGIYASNEVQNYLQSL